MQRPFHYLACLFAITAVAVRPAAYGSASPFHFNLLIHLTVVVAAVFWLLDSILARRLTLSRCWIGIPAFIYVLAVAVSPFFAAYKYAALQALFVWLSNALLFFLVVNLSKDKKIAAIFLAALLASMAAAAAHGLFQRFGGFEIKQREAAESGFLAQFPTAIDRELAEERLLGDESYATFITSNVFATFLITALPAAILWLAASLKGSSGRFFSQLRVACLIAAVCGGLLALWFSGSSAGMAVFALQMLILAAILLWQMRRRGRLRSAALLALLLVVVAGAAAALPRLAASKSVQFRFGYWESSLGVIRDHWAGGVGLENFRWSYTQYKTATAGEVAHPHNSIVQAFAELGVAGGVSFLAMWAIFAARAFLRRRPDAPEVKASIRDDESPPRPWFVTTGVFAAVMVFAVITAGGAMEGLSISDPLGTKMAVAKSAVWLVVFLFVGWPLAAGGRDERRFDLLGLGAAVGAAGFFLHSLFDVGISSFAANQAMWVALGCAVALRMPRSSPVVNIALKPVSQILLALVAVAALMFYVAAPLRLAMQENIYYTSATDLLEESGKRTAASADYRRRAEKLADEVTAYSLDTAAYNDAAEIFRRLSARRPAEKTRWLLRAVDVMKKAIALNQDDFALYGDTAILLEKISPDELQAKTEALEMWNKAIKRYPNNPALRVRRADLLDRMGAEAARVAADLEYAKFLLAQNRDARGEVVHKSLELEPLPLPGEAESLLAIYHRLCPKYSLSP